VLQKWLGSETDIVPTIGYAMIVDGHFKTQFSDEGAEESGKRIACELPNAKSRSLRRFGES
jgi:hypothetical protein